jgi:Uma2 family endonuclease
MTAKHSISVEEFAQMETADDEAYELVDGELIPLASASPLHGLIRDRITHLIWSYFERFPVGGSISEIDCRLARNTVRRPDLAIFLGDRWQQLSLKAVPVAIAPDIAVEVYPPSEHVIDSARKVRDYLNSGTQEVWLLDPENLEFQVRTKSGIRLLGESDVLETALLPGFSASVSTLLAGR